jgi:hypothetical protein
MYGCWCIIIGVIFDAFLSLAASTSTSPDVDNDNHSAIHSPISPQSSSIPSNLDWCQKHGFDATQLACSTCESILLPILLLKQQQPSSSATTATTNHSSTSSSSSSSSSDVIIDQCRQCCQIVRDVQLITEPYAAAVIVVPAQVTIDNDYNSQVVTGLPSTELNDFYQNDYTKLMQTIGTHRLRTIHDDGTLSKQQQHQNRRIPMNLFFMFSLSPVVLYFLDTIPTSSSLSKINISDLQRMSRETVTLDGWKRDDIRDMISTLLVKNIE